MQAPLFRVARIIFSGENNAVFGDENNSRKKIARLWRAVQHDRAAQRDNSPPPNSHE
jgi:hypothetical protein